MAPLSDEVVKSAPAEGVAETKSRLGWCDRLPIADPAPLQPPLPGSGNGPRHPLLVEGGEPFAQD
jgi:hypothetical protein